MNLEFLHIPEKDAVRTPHEAVHQQIYNILQAYSVPERHAKTTADALTKASLFAVDTHGVGNIVRYAKLIKEGVYSIPQKIETTSETDTTAVISAGGGLGFVGMEVAMEMAIEKAKQHGMGMVVMKDGHHIGMVGYYPLAAAREGMIGIVATNASPAMRPVFGTRAMVGTNPIAFAAPAGDEQPFLLDMATTVTASGKIALARRLGVPLPIGWAVDSEGDPVTEPPIERSNAWAQNPLGGTRDQGAHKGYGLGLMVDVLTGVLSGGGFSAILSSGQNMSCAIALNVESFRPLSEFEAMMQDMMKMLRSSSSEPGTDGVMVPGDPEYASERERRAKGIPLHKTQHEEIVKCAREVGAEVVI